MNYTDELTKLYTEALILLKQAVLALPEHTELRHSIERYLDEAG